MSTPVATSSAPIATTGPVAPVVTDAAAAHAAANATPVTPPVEAAKAEAPKTPTQAEIRKLKLKLDGQDIELPEEEIIRLAQMGGSAQKRFQEAAAEKKRAVEVLEFLKANPKEALKKLGIDLRKFSEETLTEIIKQDAESPEAKRAREAEDKVREYERERAETRAAAEKQKLEKEEADRRAAATKKERELIEQFDRIFVAALDKSGVPKTPYSIARMAQLQRIANTKGYQLGPDQLAKLVKEDYDREHQQRIESVKTPTGELDGNKLIEQLGDAVVNAITKAKVAKLKSAKQAFSQPPAESTQSNSTPASRGSWREFSKKNRRSV